MLHYVHQLVANVDSLLFGAEAGWDFLFGNQLPDVVLKWCF